MTVYALQCQQTRNVKIGYTARLVQTRLCELRTAASTPIELVKWYPGLTQNHESRLHDVFTQYRVAGEWFKQDVLALIDHETEALFQSGETDYTALAHNGAAIKTQVMTVSVAVLNVGTQNMKMSFFEQMPGRILCKEKVKWTSVKDQPIPEHAKGLLGAFDYSVKEGNSQENYYYSTVLHSDLKVEKEISGYEIKVKAGSLIAPSKGLTKWAIAPKEELGHVWGRVSIPLKHYGNVAGYNSYLVSEKDGQLEKLSLGDYKETHLYSNFEEIKTLLETSQQLFFGA
jgi:Meiotically up-regulated gene 113